MALDGRVDRIVAQFKLNAPAIQAVCAGVQGRMLAAEGEQPLAEDGLEALLWDTCRAQTRPRLDDLAQRIEPAATWDDLIVPDTQRAILREIAMHVRQRSRVYETWDFMSKGQRGLGISALFAGASGVGKTMAAEVLARELRLDLHRIDLSAVFSKYIGETEKNLRRVFEAAETGGVILLFDEADALFGKRSEVKDSHDRYANVEVAYLLQRMEAYRGLAILTTNLKEALATAFLRRSFKQALGQRLRGPAILFEDGCYRLSPDLNLRIDVAEFDSHYRRGLSYERNGRIAEAVAAYRAAIALYQGDLLMGNVDDASTIIEREHLTTTFLMLLSKLGQHCLAKGDYESGRRPMSRA